MNSDSLIALMAEKEATVELDHSGVVVQNEGVEVWVKANGSTYKAILRFTQYHEALRIAVTGDWQAIHDLKVANDPRDSLEHYEAMQYGRTA